MIQYKVVALEVEDSARSFRPVSPAILQLEISSEAELSNFTPYDGSEIPALKTLFVSLSDPEEYQVDQLGEAIETCLQNQVSIHSTVKIQYSEYDSATMTPLAYAVDHRMPAEAIQQLLDAGADSNDVKAVDTGLMSTKQPVLCLAVGLQLLKVTCCLLDTKYVEQVSIDRALYDARDNGIIVAALLVRGRANPRAMYQGKWILQLTLETGNVTLLTEVMHRKIEDSEKDFSAADLKLIIPAIQSKETEAKAQYSKESRKSHRIELDNLINRYSFIIETLKFIVSNLCNENDGEFGNGDEGVEGSGGKAVRSDGE